MNAYEVLGIIIGVVALVLAIIYIVVPMAIKKGLKVDKYLESADKNIDIIKDAVDTVGRIVPIPQLELIDKILVYADKAVQEAEQLYKIGEIQADDRKNEAKDYIIHVLTMAKIEVTPDVEKVIDGAIRAGVFVLPKTHTSTIAQSMVYELNKNGVYAPQSTLDSPSTSDEAVSTVTGNSTTM